MGPIQGDNNGDCWNLEQWFVWFEQFEHTRYAADERAEIEAGVSTARTGFTGGKFVGSAVGYCRAEAERAAEQRDCRRTEQQSHCAGVQTAFHGFAIWKFVGGTVGLLDDSAGFSESGGAGFGASSSSWRRKRQRHHYNRAKLESDQPAAKPAGDGAAGGQSCRGANRVQHAAAGFSAVRAKCRIAGFQFGDRAERRERVFG